MVKHPPASAGDMGLIPGSGRSPGKKMATHSSILVWEIPRTEEPYELQSIGSQKSWTGLSGLNNNKKTLLSELSVKTQE